MKVFLPVVFLSVVNKLIECEFGKRDRYLVEVIACILLMGYSIKEGVYMINGMYIILLLILDYIIIPFFATKFDISGFLKKEQIKGYERKYFLHWMSIIDVAFGISVNLKIYGHYIIIAAALKNSIIQKYVSIDNFRYIYNIFIAILTFYIVKSILTFQKKKKWKESGRDKSVSIS